MKIPIQQKTPAQYLQYLRGCLYRFNRAKHRDNERIASTLELIEIVKAGVTA